MFTAKLPQVDYRPPWDIDFDERLEMLTRGSPRAAYFYERPDTSTFRYRCYNVAIALGQTGPGGPSSAWFHAGELDRMDHILDLCDVLVLCRTRYTDRIARLVELAKARGRRVLFDSDDLVFNPKYIHTLIDTLDYDMRNMAVWDDWFASVGRLGAVFGMCDGAVLTNPYLAQRAGEAFGDSRPVRIIPNFLERAQQALSQEIWDAKLASDWARDGRIHIGYFSGTPTHKRDFAIAAPALAQLMDEDQRLVLRIVGFLDLPPELQRHAARVEFFPLQDHMNLQRLIGEVEVNIVPLQDNVFTNCKSELKFFEAAPVGALTVAAPTYTFRNSIVPDQTGWLAPAHRWAEMLRKVIEDLDEHRPVAVAARDMAVERYGWDKQAATITAALFGP